MHNDEQLEARLRGLSPRKPSRNLYDRVLEATSENVTDERGAPLTGSMKPRFRFPRYVEVPVAIAASLLIVLCIKYIVTPTGDTGSVVADAVPQTNRTAPIEVYQPTRVASRLVSCERERVTGESRPMYRYQFHLVDDLEWENKKDGTVVRLTRPRQEVVVVECPLL